MAFVIGRAVVQESSNAATLLEESVGVQYDDTRDTHTSTMCINHQRKAVEWADGVDAGGPNAGLAVLGIPQLQDSTGSFRATRSELELCCPLRLDDTIHRLLSVCAVVLMPFTYGLCAHRDPRVLPG